RAAASRSCPMPPAQTGKAAPAHNRRPPPSPPGLSASTNRTRASPSPERGIGNLTRPVRRAKPGSLHLLAGEFAGLPCPVAELRLVELPVLMDVEVAHVRVFRLARRPGPQRRAAQERDLDVAREAMEVEEPALGAARTVEGRIP